VVTNFRLVDSLGEVRGFGDVSLPLGTGSLKISDTTIIAGQQVRVFEVSYLVPASSVAAFIELSDALVWGSTSDQTVETHTVGPGTAALAALTVTTGQTDPWGGTTAVLVTDIVAASQAHHISYPPASALVTGAKYRCTYYIRRISATANSLISYVNATANNSLLNIDDMRINYSAGGRNQRARIRVLPDGWREVEIDYVAAADPRLRLQFPSNFEGFGTDHFYLVPPVYTRVSVSAQANLASGSAATITQGTALDRPSVELLGWLGANAAIRQDGVAGHLAISEIPALLSGENTPWSAAFLLEPGETWKASGATTGGQLFRLAGTTASLTVTQTATGLSVTRIDDAAASTALTIPLAFAMGLPQVVSFDCNSEGELRTYVNGVQVGSTQDLGTGTYTYTSARIGGPNHLYVKDWAIWDQPHSVQVVATALANARGVSTAPINLYLGLGQSNSGERGVAIELDYADVFDPGIVGSINRALGIGGSNAASLAEWKRSRMADVFYSTTIQYAENEARFGWERSFTLTKGRCAVVKVYRGGTSLGLFRDGQTYHTDMVTEFSDAVADLAANGIAYTVRGLVIVAGEANVNNSGEVAAYTDWIEELRTEIEGIVGQSIPVVVHPQIHPTVGGSFVANLRTNLTNWAAANTATRKLIATSDLTLDPDNVHYSSSMTWTIGERIAAEVL
jgi:hypothetical protein